MKGKNMNEKDKEHQTAIVTGASSGIGLGITLALLEQGYRVVANSRTISKSKDLKPSANLILVDGDIGKKETAIKVVDAAMKHFGPHRSSRQQRRHLSCQALHGIYRCRILK